MRQRIISFLKQHPTSINCLWKLARVALWVWGLFVPLQKKTMIFCSFGGRKFDDSPKAIYDEVCGRSEFSDWRLIWAFVDPDLFVIPRGEKVKIDTVEFFRALLYSRVWISNSGMDRGIELHRKKNIIVETWHGTPLKKICGEENSNSLGGKVVTPKGKPDRNTIRCAQSEFDRDIFSRVFNADKNAILLSDLPRNDALLRYSDEDIKRIRTNLQISCEKKVILYAPTYREYLLDEKKETFLAPPIDLEKWEKMLGEEYCLLVRAHYAVTKAMDIKENNFVKDVSKYSTLNDLYIISDIMVSDYSSTFFDYSILERPMLCFAYDLNEYEEKRGLYLDLREVLPCPIDETEEEVINHIIKMDEDVYVKKAKEFHKKYAPFSGSAAKRVVDEIINRL